MSSGPPDGIDDLEQFRPYLALLVRTRVDRRIVAKVDLSGVVQLTILEAHQSRDRLAHFSTSELMAWLRRALGNNLIDEIRRAHARGRLPEAEVSVEESLEGSGAQFKQFFASNDLCPAEQYARGEQFVLLAKCLGQLPEAQRRAIELNRLEGRTLEQTAEELGCTKPAVAGLLRRGISRLRTLMAES